MKIDKAKLSAWANIATDVLVYGFAAYGLLSVSCTVLEHLLS